MSHGYVDMSLKEKKLSHISSKTDYKRKIHFYFIALHLLPSDCIPGDTNTVVRNRTELH